MNQSEKSTVWEELMGVEKLIIHTAKDPSEKASLQQLIELLSVGTVSITCYCTFLSHVLTEDAGKFMAADIMSLSAMAYSLAGQPFPRDEERKYQEAIITNLIEFPQVRCAMECSQHRAACGQQVSVYVFHR